MEDEQEDDRDTDGTPHTAKKAYETPRLVIHGTVSEITQTSAGALTDVGGLGSIVI